MKIRISQRLDDVSLCGRDSKCPAVFKTDEGDYIVIGLNVTDLVDNFSQFSAGCAEEELAVKVPKAVFESIKLK